MCVCVCVWICSATLDIQGILGSGGTGSISPSATAMLAAPPPQVGAILNAVKRAPDLSRDSWSACGGRRK